MMSKRMQLGAAVVIATFFLWPLALAQGIASHADVEPNGTCSSASAWTDSEFGTGEGFSTGSLSSSDILDYSKTRILQYERVSFSMTPPSTADYDIALFTPTCSTQLAGDGDGGAGQNELINQYKLNANSGWYRFLVNRQSGSGTYDAHFTLYPDDGGFGGDAGDTHTTNTVVGSGTHKATIPVRDGDVDTDWWKIDVNAGQKLTVRMTGECVDSNSQWLRLYKGDGATVIGSNLATTCNEKVLVCSQPLFSGNTHVHPVVGYASGFGGGYTMVLTRESGSGGAGCS